MSSDHTIVQAGIVSSVGNLTINPGGSGVLFSGKTLANIGTVSSVSYQSTSSTGLVFKAGNTTSPDIANASPSYITLGNTYYDANAAALRYPYDLAAIKLRIYEAGSGGFGLGVSPASFNYVSTTGSPHKFWVGALNPLTVASTGITTSNISATSLTVPEITTASSSDLSLKPTGPNITFNNKNLVNIGSITSNAYLNANSSIISSVGNVAANSTFLLTGKDSYVNNYGISWNPRITHQNLLTTCTSLTGQYVFFSVNGSSYINDSYGEGVNIQSLYQGNSVTMQNSCMTPRAHVIYGTHTSVGVYRSTNYGLTFSLTNFGAGISAISCSEDGSRLVGSNSTAIYTTDDYGETRKMVLSGNWRDTRLSRNGRVIVGVNSVGGVYLSKNFGASFIKVLTITPSTRSRCSVSANGRVIAVTNPEAPTPAIHVSQNGGLTFSTLSYISSAGGGVYSQPKNVDMSDDGQYILYTERYPTEDLYLSRDYGSTFTIVHGLTDLNANDAELNTVMSGDGKLLIRLFYSGTNSWQTGLHFSRVKANTINYSSVDMTGPVSISNKLRVADLVVSGKSDLSTVRTSYIQGTTPLIIENLDSITTSTQGQLGIPVAATQNPASFGGFISLPSYSLSTNDANITTISTIPTVANSTIMLDAKIVGTRADTLENCSFKIDATLKNSLGVVSLVSPSIVTTFKSSGAAGCDANISISGANVALWVNGILSQDWRWTCGINAISSIVV